MNFGCCRAKECMHPLHRSSFATKSVFETAASQRWRRHLDVQKPPRGTKHGPKDHERLSNSVAEVWRLAAFGDPQGAAISSPGSLIEAAERRCLRAVSSPGAACHAAKADRSACENVDLQSTAGLDELGLAHLARGLYRRIRSLESGGLSGLDPKSLPKWRCRR